MYLQRCVTMVPKKKFTRTRNNDLANTFLAHLPSLRKTKCKPFKVDHQPAPWNGSSRPMRLLQGWHISHRPGRRSVKEASSASQILPTTAKYVRNSAFTPIGCKVVTHSSWSLPSRLCKRQHFNLWLMRARSRSQEIHRKKGVLESKFVSLWILEIFKEKIPQQKFCQVDLRLTNLNYLQETKKK